MSDKVRVGDQIRIPKLESEALEGLPSLLLGKVYSGMSIPGPSQDVPSESTYAGIRQYPIDAKIEDQLQSTTKTEVAASNISIPMREFPGAPSPAITEALAEIAMREFSTGATRSSDTGKPSYLKYISHPVWVRYGKYMLEHETQADGKKREAGNWQKGIPSREALESLARHMTDSWGHLDGTRELFAEEYADALCAIIFNAASMLHEQLRAKK